MKRMQISVKQDAMKKLLDVVKKCNEDFLDGHVSTTDVVDWMIESASFDIQKIRLRCLNPLKVKANSRLKYRGDVDALIKKLNMIKPLLEEQADEKEGKE